MSVRRVALTALMEISEGGAYANLCLKQAVAGLEQRDAKWVCAQVYGVLSRLEYLDYILDSFIKGRQKPVIRCILRLGAQEILFMRTPIAVACNENVALTKEIGKGALSGYVNGVLRALARQTDALPPLPEDGARRLSIQYSWPLWIVQEWAERFGEEETEALFKCSAHPMCLRAQPPFTSAMLREFLCARGIAFTQGELAEDCFKLSGGLSIAREELFLNGKVTVQSEGAMLCCLACGVEEGMRVLDACAAPGGKSGYLYALGKGKINLTAWELHPHRKELLDKTLKRLHAQAGTSIWDAAMYEEKYASFFDVVLLDVPCSGLGVAGGKPDVRYNKNEAGILALCKIQKNILETCSRYVRPGGAIVYASCTISRKENEEQIERFLQTHTGFYLDDLTQYYKKTLTGMKKGYIQLLPHKHFTEGFFIARMKRAGGNGS